MQIIRDDKCARTERGTAHHTSQARRTQGRTQNWASVVGAGPKKLVLGRLKKETMVTVGPLLGALKPRLRYETSSNRRVVVNTTVAADSEGPAPHVSVRPRSGPRPGPPAMLIAVTPLSDVRPAFFASVFDWFLNYLGCCALSLFCANYVTKP